MTLQNLSHSFRLGYIIHLPPSMLYVLANSEMLALSIVRPDIFNFSHPSATPSMSAGVRLPWKCFGERTIMYLIPSGWLKVQKRMNMMTSPKWKHFPCYWLFVWGIHRSPHWIPRTKASDAELWCFLRSASWINGWFESPSSSLWRHCNCIWFHPGGWKYKDEWIHNILAISVVLISTVGLVG